MPSTFFVESMEQSRVKATIVAKYFAAWAKVIMPTTKKWARNRGATPRIAYIDLFAGPGRYEDGSASTPLLVLDTALQDTMMREMLVTIFNDKDSTSAGTLQREIAAIPGIDQLKNKPIVYNHEIGENIVKTFANMTLVPTLFFVDPWGYKGLSLKLINSVLKDWGCDCIFFFNYNRINMGLSNPLVEEHMDALFGEHRSQELREKLSGLSPFDREMTIVEELAQALKSLGGKFVLPFCFKNESGKRTSHHLIFVSKHFKGYEIMKEVMAAQSSKAIQGVPSFAYNPADVRYPMLFEIVRPLDELGKLLLDQYQGKTLPMRDIYLEHSVGRQFVARNYKDILRQLEAAGQIQVLPDAASRRKRKGVVTMADNVLVTFPACT